MVQDMGETSERRVSGELRASWSKLQSSSHLTAFIGLDARLCLPGLGLPARVTASLDLHVTLLVLHLQTSIFKLLYSAPQALPSPALGGRKCSLQVLFFYVGIVTHEVLFLG